MRPASVTVAAVAASSWLPLDHAGTESSEGLFFKPGAGVTATLQVTGDNVFDPTVTPTAIDLPAPFAGMTTNVAAALPFSARAIRINQTVGAALSTLTVVSRGIAG